MLEVRRDMLVKASLFTDIHHLISNISLLIDLKEEGLLLFIVTGDS